LEWCTCVMVIGTARPGWTRPPFVPSRALATGDRHALRGAVAR